MLSCINNKVPPGTNNNVCFFLPASPRVGDFFPEISSGTLWCCSIVTIDLMLKITQYDDEEEAGGGSLSLRGKIPHANP